jgi:hypothetical protein
VLTRHFGGSAPDASFSEEIGRAVATDGVNRVALTGTYYGPIDFGGGALPDPGANAGLFVAMLDLDGGHLWSHGFADPGSGGLLFAPHADGNALALLPSGGVVVAGAFAGSVDFGTGLLFSADPLAGPDSGIAGGCLLECATDIVVVNLASDGSTRWARRFGGNDADSANAVAVDAVGNVYVAGSTSGAVDLGDGADASYGGRDIFLLALDADGGFLWQRRFGGTADDAAFALAVDDAGFVLGGRYQENVDFGGGATLSSFAIPDGFAARLDKSGTGMWAASTQVTTHAFVSGVALDSQGAAWVVGTFRGTTTGTLGPLTSAFDDAFATKLSPAGMRQFSRRYGGTLNDAAYGVAVGPADHPFITGSVDLDPVNFGGGPLSGGASDDVFVLELDPQGAHICSRRYAAPLGGSAGHALAVDAAGRISVTGSFFGTVDMGAGPMTAASGTDVFFSVFESR